MSREEWIHGEGRLGEGPTGKRPGSPAGFGATLGDFIAQGQTGWQNMVCWRCGAIAYESGPCTEKRGDGPPWQHHYADRRLIHPWPDYPLTELIDLARYLAGKSASSIATAKAFEALVRYGPQLGLTRNQRYRHRFAMELYEGKAAKRIRLLDWVLDEIDLRMVEAKEASNE